MQVICKIWIDFTLLLSTGNAGLMAKEVLWLVEICAFSRNFLIFRVKHECLGRPFYGFSRIMNGKSQYSTENAQNVIRKVLFTRHFIVSWSNSTWKVPLWTPHRSVSFFLFGFWGAIEVDWFMFVSIQWAYYKFNNIHVSKMILVLTTIHKHTHALA